MKKNLLSYLKESSISESLGQNYYYNYFLTTSGIY